MVLSRSARSQQICCHHLHSREDPAIQASKVVATDKTAQLGFKGMQARRAAMEN
jgi:hypothetical protein